ncbi:major strawberry allergen Fra a 1.06-like [Punica granatum]|uniref:Major strawberry allergen Fra a 1.06-like n=1 Tax=Punica granatum TaxID=22663 RepID=A0A218XTG6_PUNGR|nr:major strawberry allergen Fra a 1.06-like [Punica granatum]OWM88120.1 hypothetical protein CDL15_Pgr016693 [Punica granatum]
MEVVCPFKMFLIPICRERVFKGLVIDAHNLIPELAPHIMKSIKTVHGDGGPGTIRECTYNEESGYSGLTSTLRIDILDAENFVYRHTIIKGVVYGRMHSVVHEMKFESLGHDKCICKVSTEYHLKEGITFPEEDVLKGGRLVMGLCKTIVDYLVANPNAYA